MAPPVEEFLFRGVLLEGPSNRLGVPAAPDEVTVTASADLDCDGTLSTYAYKGKVTAEDVEFETDAPIETNPLD